MAKVFQTRKLHRQRVSRRKRAFVLNRDELAEHFQVSASEVEAALSENGIDFHTDSTGGVFASIDLPGTSDLG